MVKSNLVELLRSFSLNEIKEFGEYINSPFFNKNQSVKKLFDYIRKQYPQFRPEKLKKELIYSVLFPGTEYNDGLVRTLIFLLTQNAEQYLSYVNYKSDLYKEKQSLLDELNKRGLIKLFEKVFRLYSKELEKIKKLDAAYYYALFNMENLKRESDSSQPRVLSPKEVHKDEDLKTSDYLIIFFIIGMLNRYIFILNRKHLINTKEDIAFMKEIITHLEQNKVKYIDVPEIILLYNQLMLNLNPDEKIYFDELKIVVLDMNRNLKFIERYNGLVVLLNFCLRRFNAGDVKYLSEYFEMTKFMLAHGYYSFSEGGFFVTQHFKNIVSVSLILKEFDWAENFIHRYKKKLSPETSENAFNFSMSKTHFEKEDFEKALQFINKVSYEDLYYKLEIRTQALKIYYELGMYAEAFDLIDSYRKFIVHNKLLNEKLKNKHIKFMKFSGNLMKIRSSGNKKNLPMLKKQILNSPGIISYGWLLKKIEE